MMLLTQENKRMFEKLGPQDIPDPVVVVKFFYPAGAGTWLATAYNPQERMFFGYVSLFNNECNELGYFSLDELEQIRGRFGLGIERDVHFKPCLLSVAKAREQLV